MLKVCQTEFKHNKSIDCKSQFFEYNRLSNNNAESYFSHLKNNLLQLEKRKMKNKLTLSQLAIPIFQDLQSKYIEFGYLNYNFKDKSDKRSTKEAIEEVWKDKKNSINREKGFYYNNDLKLSKFNSITTQTGKILSIVE
jgi:hypothetical protein